MRIGLLFLVLSVFSSSLRAEIKGCTQPLAVNYVQDATKDDGSCGFRFCPDILSIQSSIVDSIHQLDGHLKPMQKSLKNL